MYLKKITEDYRIITDLEGGEPDGSYAGVHPVVKMRIQ